MTSKNKQRESKTITTTPGLLLKKKLAKVIDRTIITRSNNSTCSSNSTTTNTSNHGEKCVRFYKKVKVHRLYDHDDDNELLSSMMWGDFEEFDNPRHNDACYHGGGGIVQQEAKHGGSKHNIIIMQASSPSSTTSKWYNSSDYKAFTAEYNKIARKIVDGIVDINDDTLGVRTFRDKKEIRRIIRKSYNLVLKKKGGQQKSQKKKKKKKKIQQENESAVVQSCSISTTKTFQEEEEEDVANQYKLLSQTSVKAAQDQANQLFREMTEYYKEELSFDTSLFSQEKNNKKHNMNVIVQKFGLSKRIKFLGGATRRRTKAPPIASILVTSH